MEKEHFKIRKDTVNGTDGIVFYDIRKSDGERYGYITNWINDKGKVRQFADCTHGSKDPDIDDLPF